MLANVVGTRMGAKLRQTADMNTDVLTGNCFMPKAWQKLVGNSVFLQPRLPSINIDRATPADVLSDTLRVIADTRNAFTMIGLATSTGL